MLSIPVAIGVTEDTAASNKMTYIRKDADKGDATAQFKLAELYRSGSEGIQSYKDAVY